MSALFVYITASSREEALDIGRAVVGERLAACANVLDGMRSIYWWQGRLMEEKEAAMILKTEQALLPSLIRRVRELHSYECPCVVALSIQSGNPDYLTWIARETGSPAE
jgi:periplasmic divalent cation tolerance protein